MLYSLFVFANKTIKKITVILARVIIRISNDTITIVYKSYSGSNSLALIKNLPEAISENYKVHLIRDSGKSGVREYIHKLKMLMKSQLIVTTHGPIKYRNGQISIELWHGFPLKGMIKMHKDLPVDKKNKYAGEWNNVDYVVSYSQLYSTAMNSCINSFSNKYVITGAPRNDYLFSSFGRNLLSNITNVNIKDKMVMFYFPTFRQGFSDLIDGELNIYNIFGFSNFDNARLDEFLDQNNICLFIKLHPNEKNRIESMRNLISERLILFEDSSLEERETDLYEVLNGIDILLTDYSSIYFDYLLLDRPIIFLPHDLEYYRETRGFLLEPYDFWTPGPKVFSQDVLEAEILNFINNKDYYSSEREIIKNLIHYYKDGKSSERVWGLVDNLLSHNKHL